MRATLCVLVAALVALAGPASAGAARPKPGKRIERVVHSRAPDRRRVKESFVRVYAPLPKSAGAHPARCDWVSYLRFRDARGPRRPSRADAVFVIIPGFLGGAGSFDQVARNTVRDAAARHRHVEFWALDRRSNCLEDHSGVSAAARKHDGTVGYGYYWGGKKTASGKRFKGWVSEDDARWLDNVGLAQTMKDWYAVLKRIPRRVRQRKVFCGGHSMGGPLTASFAAWDFDGNTRTRRDAGYRQCAGFVGLDTRLQITTPGSSTPSSSSVLLDAIIASGSPYVNTSPITPETIQLPPIFGVGSYFDPQRTDMLKKLPHSQNIDLAQRFLFSRNAANFATGIPSIRDYTTTNQVTLAGVFDDNSAPLFFLRSSLGFLHGGKLADKNFPTKDPTLALPADTHAPLYSWQSYRTVGAGGRAISLNEEGQPYTTRESEVSDVRQFARTTFEAPADFIEQYFPTRLLKDLQNAGKGDRSGDLSHIKYDSGVTRHPAIIVRAGDSASNSAAPDTGPPKAGPRPNSRPLSRSITIPGYNHLDVITAARRQNDGRAEPSSLALARFALAVRRRLGRH